MNNIEAIPVFNSEVGFLATQVFAHITTTLDRLNEHPPECIKIEPVIKEGTLVYFSVSFDKSLCEHNRGFEPFEYDEQSSNPDGFVTSHTGYSCVYCDDDMTQNVVDSYEP